jgi:hypothetical protein
MNIVRWNLYDEGGGSLAGKGLHLALVKERTMNKREMNRIIRKQG